MTIEKTATFTVHDLKAFGIECPQCKTIIVIPLLCKKGDVVVDESLYCPRCKQDGDQIIWTANASDPDKKLAAALVAVRQQSRTQVRMIAPVEGS